MDWTRAEISELILLYKQFECLWNFNNPNYSNLEAKQSAWQVISEACGKEIADIKRKVKHLRSAYVLEKKKLEASKERGICYKPNLFYYEDINFLDSFVVLRKASLPSSIPRSFISPKNSENTELKQKFVPVDRKTLRDTKFNNAIDSIVASVQKIQSRSTSDMEEEHEGNNVFYSFGKTTALQLQQLPFDKATEAMAAIYQHVAKKTLESLKESQNQVYRKRKNGVISFETMSP